MARQGRAERQRRSCAATVLLLGLLGLVSCGGARDAYQRVVLVSINSLRWDHLGSSGYPRPTTPFLDELAAGGVAFDRAYAASARSAISVATLLTGLEPREHGLRDPEGSLDAGVPTLAERLAARGFRTAAFVSYWPVFEPRGLARGFAHWESPPELAQHPYRSADRTVDAALAWLEQHGADGPAFLYLQLQDPARPYRAPPVYAPMVVDGDRLKEHYAYLEREHGLPLGWYGWDHARLNAVFNNYDAELRFVDTELQRLRDGLAALGLLDGTLFVVTSEHGAGLGNHFWDTAGQVLYEEEVRVPLILAAGDGRLAPRRIADVVSHVDVLPTILALVGGEEALAALDPAPGGRSLVPLVEGGSLAPRPAFFDRGTPVRLNNAQRELVARSPIPPREGPLVGGVDGRWKLLDYAGTDDELYDLASDPFERENRIGEDGAVPPEVEPLRKAVSARFPVGGAASGPTRDR